MDKTSIEEYRKGKRYFILFSVIILGACALVSALFTGYKQETLICTKVDDQCIVQRTNLLNLKSNKELIKLSEIKSVTSTPQRVTGNMYAKGYTSYFLTFKTKENNSLIVFATDYYEKGEIDKIINKLKLQIKNGEDIILNRN